MGVFVITGCVYAALGAALSAGTPQHDALVATGVLDVLLLLISVRSIRYVRSSRSWFPL